MIDTNRCALVTGGAQGIGKATAAHLMREGYNVVIADCDAAAGAEAVEELGAGAGLLFVETDVAREADVAEAVRRAVARFGRLDLLVNNAGVFESSRRLSELSLAD